MKKASVYQWTVEIISILIMSMLLVGSLLFIGVACRLIWAGFLIGFTGFGHWP
jgi:hypothetical protein